MRKFRMINGSEATVKKIRGIYFKESEINTDIFLESQWEKNYGKIFSQIDS